MTKPIQENTVSEEDEILSQLYQEDAFENAALVQDRKNIRVRKAAMLSVLMISLLTIVYVVFLYLPIRELNGQWHALLEHLGPNMWKFIAFGFIAQMIDGALGMAYGVTVTTFLLGSGISGITPAVASASMHASEIFTTGSSSLVYMRFRNINMKLFKALVWPGVLGTIAGVVTVSFVSKEYFSVIKPIVAVYTLTLGVLIVFRAIRKPVKRKKVNTLYPIAFSGGFLDSVGGGGWGPIVTSSLLAGGRHLRYAVGSAHLAKFFVAVVSTVTFFFMIGLSHWHVIFGLVVGGMIAAPVSIYISNKIPIKKGLIFVGILICVISIRTLLKTFL
ncbi:MAG: hypothetical protein RIT43_1366 [Bacteroidota bacterium]|jgi:uncharacterized membrane protein YfcA